MESMGRTGEIILPELLAPAGSMQSFLAAVESGADAVYIGAKDFSARQYAENFSDKDIENAVKYAHLRGVKVYLAFNTLIMDDEMQKALEVIYRACSNNIDAVIVQDIGLASELMKIMPEVKLHASTQMTAHNFEGVNLLKKLGFKRAVLARELTLEQINDIVQRASDIELEIFVHGALCYSYSGQCLFSSLVGGRSGNRGRCAQPCRQKYKLVDLDSGKEVYEGDNGEYLLSTRDLCTVEMLPEIIKAGISSLKIEGRMKSPGYVATVTRMYRKHIDFIGSGRKFAVKDDDIRDLKLVFNRGGFTRGFLGRDSGSELMSIDSPSHRGIECGKIIEYDSRAHAARIELSSGLRLGDVIKLNPGDEESTTITRILVNGEKAESGAAKEIVEVPTSQVWRKGDTVLKVHDKKLAEKAASTYSGRLFKKVPLYAQFAVSFGNPIELKVWDDEGNNVEIKGKKAAEEAKKVALTPEKVLEQLESTGNTPFYLAKTEIQMEDELFLPLSEINDVRRRAVEEIGRVRIEGRTKNCGDEKTIKAEISRILEVKETPETKKSPEISVFIADSSLLEQVKLFNISRVYIPSGEFFQDKIIPGVIEELVKKGKEVFLSFPRITTKTEMENIYENITRIENYGFSGVLVGNYGLVKMFKILKNFKINADYSFNLFNRFSVKTLEEQGLNGVTISPELELKQIEKAVNGANIETEAIVHGRIPLMISRFCMLRSLINGQNKGTRHCSICKKGTYGLKDKTGVTFPIVFNPEQCHLEILNSKVLCMAWDIAAVKNTGIDHLRIDLRCEKQENMAEIVNMYSRLLDEGGEILEKYQEILERIKQEGFTRGHYFRRIE